MAPAPLKSLPAVIVSSRSSVRSMLVTVTGEPPLMTSHASTLLHVPDGSSGGESSVNVTTMVVEVASVAVSMTGPRPSLSDAPK